MPIPTNPPVLESPIGTSADVFAIPSQTDSGSGALSYRDGWPAITGISLKAGGLAPQREYFNAVNKLLSQHTFFQQSGGVYPWNPALDYIAGAHVLGSDGLEYVAVAPSGPDVSGTGAKDPTASGNSSYWLLLAARIMSAQGGLVVNPSTGQASVDFSQMPDSVLQVFLQQIKVPYWLERNTAFYVNVATGSDTLDEGRGLSAGMPFKTLQNCLNYIAENYNISTFRCTVNISSGDYTPEGNINLPSYQSTTGIILLQGDTNNYPVLSGLSISNASVYWARNVKVVGIESQQGNVSRISASNGGTIQLFGTQVDITEKKSTSALDIGIMAISGGSVSIPASSSFEDAGITFLCSNSVEIYAPIMLQQGGSMSMLADISIVGDISCDSFINASDLSVFRRSRSLLAYPGRLSQINMTGTATGYHFKITGNSIVNTQGGGPDFFPGDTAGTTSTGGQYI